MVVVKNTLLSRAAESAGLRKKILKEMSSKVKQHLLLPQVMMLLPQFNFRQICKRIRSSKFKVGMVEGSSKIQQHLPNFLHFQT
jgi:ribosomal protein L10